MKPSEWDVLASLADRPKPWRQIKTDTGRDGRTVRSALKALGAMVASTLDGLTNVYRITESGKAALKDGRPPMGERSPPSGHAHGRPSTPPTPDLARGVSSTPLSNNGIEEMCSSEPASDAHGWPMGGTPTNELWGALQEVSAYARRIESAYLTKTAALELALARVAELERRLAQRVPTARAEPALPRPQEPSNVAAETVHPALKRRLDRLPTPEEFKAALEDRVEEQRKKGFKKGEAEFKSFIRREHREKPWEVFEQLDVKREREEITAARAEAAATQALLAPAKPAVTAQDARLEALLKATREDRERLKTKIAARNGALQ